MTRTEIESLEVGDKFTMPTKAAGAYRVTEVIYRGLGCVCVDAENDAGRATFSLVIDSVFPATREHGAP